MGTWSTEPFGNDAACDWAERLVRTDDLSYIEATLRVVLDYKKHSLISSDAEEAVAAAEVLAKLIGHSSQTDAYTSAVDKWIRTHPATPSASLLYQAHQALERIRNDLGLQAAWFDPTAARHWVQSLRSMQAILKST